MLAIVMRVVAGPTLLWTLLTTDLSDLSLLGAQFPLVQAIHATGTPTIVVFVNDKSVTSAWIQESKSSPDCNPCFSYPMADVDAAIQQFYPGEFDGLVIVQVMF